MTAQMIGYIKFQHAMAEATSNHLRPYLKTMEKEANETFKNYLFDLDGPKRTGRDLNAYEQYFSRVFLGFLEISKSIETLEDISFYLRRFPFSGTTIKRERYLKFHIEAYYHETYILRERILKFIKLLQRQFRKNADLQNTEYICKKLNNLTIKSFKEMAELRGNHVHEMRLNDEGINRISTFGLLTLSSDQKFSKLMNYYYREEYKKVRKT